MDRFHLSDRLEYVHAFASAYDISTMVEVIFIGHNDEGNYDE